MTPLLAHDDARSLLSAWDAPNPGQEALAQAYLGFLAARSDAAGGFDLPIDRVALTEEALELYWGAHPAPLTETGDTASEP